MRQTRLLFKALFDTDRLVPACELLSHVRVLFHVRGILIRIEMCVFKGVCPAAMTQHVLSDVDAGNPVQVGGGGMPKQPGMQLFIDPELVDQRFGRYPARCVARYAFCVWI